LFHSVLQTDDNKKVQGWVFTINNWTNADITRLAELDCQYICYGKEKGKKFLFLGY